MARAKRNLFALLGWVVWKLLSLLGIKYAKDRLRDHDGERGRSARSGRTGR